MSETAAGLFLAGIGLAIALAGMALIAFGIGVMSGR